MEIRGPSDGHVELNLRRGQDVVQVGAEVADIEQGMIATDAVVERGKSVLHSPASHWIVDGTLDTPSWATAIKLKKHQANYYFEFDEILEQGEVDQGAIVAAVRRGYRARQPAVASPETLPKTMGPEPDEQITLPPRGLKLLGQPSAEEKAAHEAHHLPYKPWCPECVEARGVDNPHHSQPALDDDAVPKVMFDIIFAGSDEMAKKYKLVDGSFSLRDKERLLSSQEADRTIAVRNLIDCKMGAQVTLFANKELDEYQVNCIIVMLDQWGHTTVILQTDQQPATMSIANAVKDRRAKSTIVRASPAKSKQGSGHAEGANRLAAGSLRTYKLKLERKIGRELHPTDPIVPFLVNAVGWMITRLQPRSHSGSSYKLIFGREYNGDIADMGEQLWYPISAQVSARGIWVGKSDIDDTHLVVDLDRGIQKVRTARRMPEEFRWNAEMLQDIRVTPWKPTPGKTPQVAGRSMYITERMIDAHGPTDRCKKCSRGRGEHSAECRQRFETIQYDLLQEKLKQAPAIPEVSAEQTVVTPAQAASEDAGIHRQEDPALGEAARTSMSSPDVVMGLALLPRRVLERGARLVQERFRPRRGRSLGTWTSRCGRTNRQM